MEKQEQTSEPNASTSTKEDEAVHPNPTVVESGKKLQEATDDLMDEIDEVLEENAAEFVKNYVQKGGQ
ncbi:MAG: ubiquitin-like protein Pup [Nitrospirales bacterium]|nr:ubiquitin-like protein Pup [Nitrospirales bacterium]